MRSEGFPKRFCFKRWVEGPLEGMMELSGDVEGYRARAQRILAVGTAAALSFLLLLTMVLIVDAWRIVFPFISSAAMPNNIPLLISTIGLSAMFMALAFFSTLLLIQIWGYASVMLKRFENVEDLLAAPKSNVSSSGKEVNEGGNQPRPYLGLFNILGASSAFTKDIVRNMPQVCNQMRFVRTMLVLMPVYYLGLRFVIPLMFGGPILPELSGILQILFEIALIGLSVLSVLAGLMVWEASRFMEALYAGLMFVDSVRNGPLPRVSGEGTPSERLCGYLDDVYGDCRASAGAKGFAIRHVSEDGLLLAIETSTAPTLELVKRFMESCKKELDNMRIRPTKGRFIILYTPENGATGDIGEDVENHILANPLVLGRGPGGGNSETVIQIMIEEDGAYGMFPFVG